MCGCSVVFSRIGCCTSGHVDSDVAFDACSGRDDQGVCGWADRGESAFGTIGNRDVVGREAGDGFAEGEGVGDVAAGDVAYAIFVIGDGERGRQCIN